MKITHQNLLNLYFRKAWLEYKSGNKNPNPFHIWLRKLKKRLKETFTKEDQWYWDILFEVNMRNKTLADILQEESKIDPDKEKWIRQQVEGGALSERKILTYGKMLGKQK